MPPVQPIETRDFPRSMTSNRVNCIKSRQPMTMTTYDYDGLDRLTKKTTGTVDINVKPTVSNEKLKNIINDLYKGQGGANTIGNGTTMDAVRNEIFTGQATNGKFHTSKLMDYVNALEKRLRAGDLNQHDEVVVKALLEDAKNALIGK